MLSRGKIGLILQSVEEAVRFNGEVIAQAPPITGCISGKYDSIYQLGGGFSSGNSA